MDIGIGRAVQGAVLLLPRHGDQQHLVVGDAQRLAGVLAGVRARTYTVKIRARNTAGAITPIVYQDTLTITGSVVTNTRPFPALTVKPARAMVGTPFLATASGSNDFETPSSGLYLPVVRRRQLRHHHHLLELDARPGARRSATTT